MKKLMFALVVAAASVAMAAIDNSVYNLTFTDKALDAESGKVVSTKMAGVVITRGGETTTYVWDTKGVKLPYENIYAAGAKYDKQGAVEDIKEKKLFTVTGPVNFKLDGVHFVGNKAQAGFTLDSKQGWGTGSGSSIAGNSVDLVNKNYGTWKYAFDKTCTKLVDGVSERKDPWSVKGKGMTNAVATDEEILAKKGVELVK